MNFKNYLSKAKYLTLGVLLSGAAVAGDKDPAAKFIKEGCMARRIHGKRIAGAV
jgi:lipid-binding SYLF domain-containing protein